MQYHAKVLKKVTTLRVMIYQQYKISHRGLLTVQREVSMINQQHNKN